MDLFSALGEARRQLEAVYCNTILKFYIKFYIVYYNILFKKVQLEVKERELNTYKTLFKQQLTIGSNNGSNINDSLQNDLISQFLANQLNSLQGNVNTNTSTETDIASINDSIPFTNSAILTSNVDVNNLQQINTNSSIHNGNNDNVSFLNTGSINYLPKI